MPPAGFQPVCRSDDLPHPQPLTTSTQEQPSSQPTIREVELGRQRVLVTRLASGQVAAFASFCPHLGTPLHRATLCGDLLRCPQHQYVYDPRSGRNIEPAQRVSADECRRLRPGRLRTHPAFEEQGWVWVGEAPNPPAD